ncbi:D-hexose-6-phosphate mutarotase [Arthrobacter sp. R4-81]
MIAQRARTLDQDHPFQPLKVSGLWGTGQVSFQGAQIVQWSPKDTGPVLWLGSRNQFLNSDPIRGGIPICLPWFGSKAAPRHGIARTLPWQLTSVDQNPEHVTLTFHLDYQITTAKAAAWAHPFQARFQAEFGQYLTMTLQVTHLGDQPALYEPALHPYLQVGDIRRVRISGLAHSPFTDHSTAGTSEPAITFTEQGLDRVYSCSRAITVHDDANNRDIILYSPYARSRILWNPGAGGASSIPDLGDDDWQSFLCVEPGNVGGNGIRLAPGEQHSFKSVIQVIQY